MSTHRRMCTSEFTWNLGLEDRTTCDSITPNCHTIPKFQHAVQEAEFNLRMNNGKFSSGEGLCLLASMYAWNFRDTFLLQPVPAEQKIPDCQRAFINLIIIFVLYILHTCSVGRWKCNAKIDTFIHIVTESTPG